MNELTDYTLHLADNALILGQRNAEWCGHGPVLEQDIAITNISLDLIGQARNFYQYAAQLLNKNKALKTLTDSQGAELNGSEMTEDKLAYLRGEREFKNCLLVELPRGDWAQTILRQFFFSAYQSPLYKTLQQRSDQQLAAIAAKSLKEVTYHLRWSSEWVIRLGDGTEESRARLLNALNFLWPYTGELFTPAAYETATGIEPSLFKNDWEENVKIVFEKAGIAVPPVKWMHTGGKSGKHSEWLGYILAEMQYLQRSYPDSQW